MQERSFALWGREVTRSLSYRGHFRLPRLRHTRSICHLEESITIRKDTGETWEPFDDKISHSDHLA